MVLEGAAEREGGEDIRDFGSMMLWTRGALVLGILSPGMYARLGIGRGCVEEAW